MPRACLVLTLAIAFTARVGLAQPSSQPAAPLNWGADDGKRVTDLTATGERREAKLVILFTPAGAIDDSEERALLYRLDMGNNELRRLIGRHAWQVVRAEKITYYISPDRFVSHASSKGAVFIPLVRVQDDRAPYLHEAAHELLESYLTPNVVDPEVERRLDAIWPVWLTEGLADYVAQTAAARAGIIEGDVFDIGGIAGANAACRDRMKGPRGSELLPFIGAVGTPPALLTTERGEVAPTFYACGLSFTKFVVDRIGLAETIALMPLILESGVLRRIEEVSKTPMDSLRAEWRKLVGIP